MKVFGIILIVLGIAAAAAAGVVAVRQLARDRVHDAETARLETLRSETIEAKTKARMTHEAVLKSIHSQPDSLRMEKSGEISMRLRDLDREVRVQTARQNELSRLIRREASYSAEEWSEARGKIVPLGAGGVVCLLGGILLVRRGRQHA